MTDQELIQGFLRGGKREYKQIVAWVSDVIRSKLWTDRVAGEDVISDTTMKLLVNLREDTFRLDSSFKTYVQRIALYTLVDASRRVRKLQALDEDSDLRDSSNPHSLAEEKERDELFERVLSMLPAKCRQLWQLAFRDDLKSKEIAARIGCSEGAVRTSFSRCRDQASGILEKIS